MFNSYLLAFVPIFVAVDALGMIPFFMALTQGMGSAKKNRLIRHAVFTALLVALVFLLVGKLVFLFLGVTMNDFLVAGGAILFILSIRDLLSFERTPRIPAEHASIVPLAVPIIVGPAVLTTSLLLLNTYGLWPTVFSLVANILLCGLTMRFSNILSKFLGEAGTRAISKIANLLLGAIGVMLMRRGILEIFIDIHSTLR